MEPPLYIGLIHRWLKHVNQTLYWSGLSAGNRSCSGYFGQRWFNIGTKMFTTLLEGLQEHPRLDLLDWLSINRTDSVRSHWSSHRHCHWSYTRKQKLLLLPPPLTFREMGHGVQRSVLGITLRSHIKKPSTIASWFPESWQTDTKALVQVSLMFSELPC